MGAQSISSRSAIHPLNSLQRFSAHREVSGRPSRRRFWRSPRARQALASLDPRNAGFGLDESLGRARSWLLRDGRRRFRSATEVRCGREQLRQAAGSWTSGQQRPILAAATGRCAIACSMDTSPPFRIPSPRARDGRVMRRILIDSRDLERLIERWKEVDNSEANLT